MAEKNESLGISAGREKRTNAGKRMQALIEEEAEDDFYRGIFGAGDSDDSAADGEYISEVEDEDEVDSDFDLEENEMDEISDEKEFKEKPLKVSRGYVDPAKKRASQKPHLLDPMRNLVHSVEKRAKSLKSKDEENVKESSNKPQTVLKNKSKKYLMPSQEELLKEAIETEKINLASLQEFKLQAEKKRLEAIKSRRQKVPIGPRIVYLSTSRKTNSSGFSDLAKPSNSDLKETVNYLSFTRLDDYVRSVEKFHSSL
eukprot:Sdes_comp20434_c0_seq2m14581